jgi:hypothetical protein
VQNAFLLEMARDDFRTVNRSMVKLKNYSLPSFFILMPPHVIRKAFEARTHFAMHAIFY